MFIRSGVIFSYKLDKSGCGWGGDAHLVCVELISEKIDGSQEKKERRRRRGRYKIYLLIVIRSSTSLSLSFCRCCCLVIEWKCVSHLSLLTVVLCALDRETTGRIGAENGYEWIKETKISRFLDLLARVGSWWEWKKAGAGKIKLPEWAKNRIRSWENDERAAAENQQFEEMLWNFSLHMRQSHHAEMWAEKFNNFPHQHHRMNHSWKFMFAMSLHKAERACSLREKGRKDNRESDWALEGWKGLSLWGDPVSFMKREIFAFHHQLENCRHTV